MVYYYKIPQNFTFGGAYIFLHELYNINNSKKKFYVNLNCDPELRKLFNINKYLDSNIRISFKKKKTNKFINLNSIIKKKQNYSFTFLYKNFKKIKFIPFKKKKILKVKNYLKKKNIKNFICIHLKKDKNKIASAKISEWIKFIKFLSIKYQVFIVNSEYYRKYFINLENIYFVPRKYNRLYFEPIISLLARAFFSNASGFCSFVNFSKTNYLILKDPKHHVKEFKGETFKNRLLYASRKQIIIKKNRNLNI